MSQTTQYFLRAGQPVFGRATALGGPLVVTRLSGKGLKSQFSKLFSAELEPRKAVFTSVAGVDHAVVIFFEAPHSFSGEDVIEVQSHGVPSLLDKIEESLLGLGATRALPGEFSFRAVLNDKMTLSQAEALNLALCDDSLNSQWAKELVGFSKLAQSKSIELVENALVSINKARGRVEASIDYPEAEEEQNTEVQAALKILNEAKFDLHALLSSSVNFSKGARHEKTLVILGEPNVGKSTLLNLLAGGERALVSNEAGTTRDYIEIKLRMPNGQKFRLVDTAGLRFGQNVGAVEAAGVSRSLGLLEEADAVIFVSNASSVFPEKIPEKLLNDLNAMSLPLLTLGSHADKVDSHAANAFDFINNAKGVSHYIYEWLQKNDLSNKSPDTWVSKRQAVLIEESLDYINKSLSSLNEEIPLELCGNFLTDAEKSLRAALGDGVSDEYIGEIFSQFCLGK